jgi:hypothetical protein
MGARLMTSPVLGATIHSVGEMAIPTWPRGWPVRSLKRRSPGRMGSPAAKLMGVPYVPHT